MQLQKGDIITFDNGLIIGDVIDFDKTTVTIEVDNGFTVTRGIDEID